MYYEKVLLAIQLSFQNLKWNSVTLTLQKRTDFFCLIRTMAPHCITLTMQVTDQLETDLLWPYIIQVFGHQGLQQSNLEAYSGGKFHKQTQFRTYPTDEQTIMENVESPIHIFSEMRWLRIDVMRTNISEKRPMHGPFFGHLSSKTVKNI